MSKSSSSTVVYHGVGRRKKAVARVWIKTGMDKIVVNGRDLGEYFPSSVCTDRIVFPIKITSYEGKIGAIVNVKGGGVSGQADATRLGIARALLEFDDKTRPVLKKQGLLRVDSRIKERKKPGQKGARKKFQFVKR